MGKRLVSLLALGVALGGCNTVNAVGGGVALGTLLCDYGQTRYHLNRNWEIAEEHNPVLGPRPSIGYLTGYFAVVTGLLGAAYYAVPKEIKWMVYVPVIMAQGTTIYGNHLLPTPVCGIGS